MVVSTEKLSAPRRASDADMRKKESSMQVPKCISYRRLTSAMETMSRDERSPASSRSSTSQSSREALETSPGHPQVPAERKTPQVIPLSSIPFSTKAVDVIVRQSKSEGSNEEGTFGYWQSMLHQNSIVLSQKALDEDGFKHPCRRRHSDPARGMTECEYLNHIRSKFDRELCSKDISNRQSMEQFDEEHSAVPSETSKGRSWFRPPATLLTAISREGRSEVGTSSSVDSCISVSDSPEMPRKNWFERPDSLKGMDVSPKPLPMKMVFFDSGKRTSASSKGSGSKKGGTSDDDCLSQKSLCTGTWRSEDKRVL